MASGFILAPSKSNSTFFSGDQSVDYIEKTYGSLEHFNTMDLPEDVLKDYAFVSVLENFNASKSAFESTFGFPSIPLRRYRSHSSGKPSIIPTPIIELIEERNQLDLKLYERVVSQLRGQETWKAES